MTLALDALAPGFGDAVLDSQAAFRAVLQAMSQPGRVVTLPMVHDADPLCSATASTLLTLLDAETSIALVGALRTDRVRAWLRFHTGAREVASGQGAQFTAVRAGELDAALWSSLALGSDDRPQDGTTLLLEVPWLHAEASTSAEQRLRLRGPGIAHSRVLAVGGVPLGFWRYRSALQAQFPRGMDLMLACERQMICIPRTTRIEMEH